jgi:hypothetical protein
MRGNAVRSLTWACLATILLLGPACSNAAITGSGKVVTKSFSVAAFSGVEASNAFVVNVSLGDREALTVRADDNLVDRLDVGVSSGTLRLGLDPPASVREATLEANVIVVSLSSIHLDGASQAHLADALTGKKVDVRLSGASMIDGSVQCDEVDLSLSGASQADLTGTAGHLVVDEDGASQLESLGLQVDNLDIELSGASQATVSVSDNISADLSGASQLHYRGMPRFTKKNASGASIIEPV